jgi:hypothetical protein
MLSTEGMSAAGLQRKATCQALFSKMLYLTEHGPLVAHGSEAFRTTDLRTVRAVCGWVGGAVALCWGAAGPLVFGVGVWRRSSAVSRSGVSATSSSKVLTTNPPNAPHPSQIFGATDEDAERMRIVSLVELDAERLDRLMAGDSGAPAAGPGSGSSTPGGGGSAPGSGGGAVSSS